MEAATWMAQVLGAKPPPSVRSGAGEEELHAWLKSGVVLCELINRIRPGSVKKTNRLVTVEEGWPACGIGAELGDCVCESGRVLRAFGQERADGSHV